MGVGSMGCGGSKSEEKSPQHEAEEEALGELTGIKKKAEVPVATAPLAAPLLNKQPSSRNTAPPSGALSNSTEKFVQKRATIGHAQRPNSAAASDDVLSGVRLSTASAGGFDDPRSNDYSKESPENDRKSRFKGKKEKPWDA